MAARPFQVIATLSAEWDTPSRRNDLKEAVRRAGGERLEFAETTPEAIEARFRVSAEDEPQASKIVEATLRSVARDFGWIIGNVAPQPRARQGGRYLDERQGDPTRVRPTRPYPRPLT
jgi:hypothetical protein